MPKWTDINFRWGFPKSIIKFSFQSSHKLLINLDSRSWVAASEMWRAGIKIQDAKKGRDCQNGRRWWQGGQGESDGWFFGRVCECEIISQACWFFFCRSIQVLVSTDCAGMGVHVPDLRLVVNVGMTMIEIFSQNCFLHTSIFQDFQGTCGRCLRHLAGPAETRSCKQLVYRCTGQARKVFWSWFLLAPLGVERISAMWQELPEFFRLPNFFLCRCLPELNWGPFDKSLQR